MADGTKKKFSLWKLLTGFSLTTVLLVFGGLIVMTAIFGGILSATTGSIAAAAAQDTGSGSDNPYQANTDYDEILAAAAERYELTSYLPVLRAILITASEGAAPDVMGTQWFMEIDLSTYTAEESIWNGSLHFYQLLQEQGISGEYDSAQLDTLLPVLKPYRHGTEAENSKFAGQVKEYLSASITALMYPISNHSISSPYGGRNLNVSGVSMSFHHGTDFPAATGTPIHAAMTGTVVFAGYLNSTYGYAVQIRWSGNATVVTLYAHCSAVAVSVNQKVQTGDVIAYVGMSGMATGPHCHLGLYLGGSDVDPMPYVLGEEALPLGGTTTIEK